MSLMYSCPFVPSLYEGWHISAPGTWQQLERIHVDRCRGVFYGVAVLPVACAYFPFYEQPRAPADVFFGEFGRRIPHYDVVPLGALRNLYAGGVVV